mmetsp:Transcript_8589/g.26357  ORF Transcript_8589/g.26357 Transcript_8589/m.26357 type:complete len:353 (-) Transcript_8589:1051-2109(-)
MIGKTDPGEEEVQFVGFDEYGKPWLEATHELIAPHIQKSDSNDGAYKVSPGAISGCSRVGKTRALIELGKRLREDGKIVIFVSFNDMTTYIEGEASSRLKSLLARIEYAIAKTGVTSGMPLHDDSMEQTTLRFTTTKRAVLDWLEANKSNDIVLLIDELNQCIKPEVDGCEEVVTFLRDHFVRDEGRCYVFTTHVSSTLEVVQMLGNTKNPGKSERVALGVGTPLVSTQLQWEVLTKNSGPHPAWFGLAAGLIYQNSQKSDVLPLKWATAFKRLQAEQRKHNCESTTWSCWICSSRKRQMLPWSRKSSSSREFLCLPKTNVGDLGHRWRFTMFSIFASRRLRRNKSRRSSFL